MSNQTGTNLSDLPSVPEYANDFQGSSSVILSGAKNLRSTLTVSRKPMNRDVGKPGLMLRISLRRFAET